MKICPKCKLSYSDEKKYCRYCGAALISRTSSESNDIAWISSDEERFNALPSDIFQLIEYARFSYNKLQYKDAILLGRKALQIEENNTTALELLYHSYLKIGDLEGAIQMGDRLLNLNPQNLSLLSDMVELLVRTHKEKEAIPYLDIRLMLYPDDLEAWVRKAELLSKVGAEKDALYAWQKVNEINPGTPLAEFHIAINACRKGDYVKASSLLEGMIDKLGNEKEANLAKLYFVFSLIKTEKNDIRISSLIRTIDFNDFRDSTNPFVNQMLVDLYFYEGQISFSKKKYEHAIFMFNKVLEIKPDENSINLISESYYRISIEDSRQNKIDGAECNIQKALDYFPDNEKYRAQLNEIILMKKSNKKGRVLLFSMVGISVLALLFVFFYLNYKNQEDAWNFARKVNTYGSYQEYMNTYENGRHRRDALLLQDDALWKEALKKHSLPLVEKYISLSENGKYIDEAKELREDILWNTAVQTNTSDAYESYLSKCDGLSPEHMDAANRFIDTTKYSAPDVEKIKADLIGKSIPGWTFDFLREFQNAQIVSQNESDDRIEYQMKFRLKDFKENDEYDCQVMVVYLKEEQGWSLSEVRKLFLVKHS